MGAPSRRVPASRAAGSPHCRSGRHRGQGYGSEAQRQLAEYLFSTRLIERLEAATEVENVAEQHALETAGFSREGILRHTQFRAGQWRDTVLYSRLRSD
ncbi:MAG: GNAT family N-acetyltransferase [Acidimicrobiales bacterium]